jgi:hypothetical protein
LFQNKKARIRSGEENKEGVIVNKELDVIYINYQALGAKLARLSTDEQVPFFKGFISEMLKYDSHFAMENQLLMISDYGKFNKKEKEIFLTLGYSE